MLHRLVSFILFLMCGLLILVPQIFLSGTFKTLYELSMAVLFLLSSISLWKKRNHGKDFQVVFAFFLMSFVLAFEQMVVGAIWPTYREGILPSTVDDIVYQKLLSTLLVVVPIVLLTKMSGKDLASIYLKRGRLKLGLLIGFATFFFFLVTSLPAATGLFGAHGRNLTAEKLVSWTPWVAAFIFSNGLREELWYRGLFLKKYESSLGVGASNFLQAIIFASAHLGSQYTTSLVVFLVISFFLGLAFGAVIQKSDSLLGSILFHAGTDVPVVLAYFSNI